MYRFVQDKIIRIIEYLRPTYSYKKVDLTESDFESGLVPNQSVKVHYNPFTIDIANLNNTPEELFRIAFSLLESKFLFVILILLPESISLITTWALLNKKYLLVILCPILNRTIWMFVQDFRIQTDYSISFRWKELVYEYFSKLSYPSRKKCEMGDFKAQVERTGWALVCIVSSGFPTIIRLGMIFSCCLYTLAIQEQNLFEKIPWWALMNSFIGTIGLVFGFYYFFRMKSKQENLTLLRKNKKDIEKKIKPMGIWNLHLFQNRKKTVRETIGIELPIIQADMIYIRGWDSISSELNIFAEIITGIILYFISRDLTSLLTNKVIFNQLINSIEYIGHLTNSIANNSKEFDRFIDWVKSSETDPMVTQKSLEFPLDITVNIELGNITPKDVIKFKLSTPTGLSIGSTDKILLRGESGIGKTQLVNSLQGLIPGAKFRTKLNGSESGSGSGSESDYDIIGDTVREQLDLSEHFDSPKYYESKWEYMNQQTRETIPSSGLTIRQMLEDETDSDLILKLVNIVILQDKFNQDNLDLPMEGLSGGERMRLSILYTLWDLAKLNKQVLILDEPEQGLDEDIRVRIIHNILTHIHKPILVIYHGSKLDLISLPFTKVWVFDKAELDKGQKQTIVTAKSFDIFKSDIVKEIKVMF